jgi:hypothetical protein
VCHTYAAPTNISKSPRRIKKNVGELVQIVQARDLIAAQHINFVVHDLEA